MDGGFPWQATLAAVSVLYFAAGTVVLCHWHRKACLMHGEAGRMLRDARVSLAHARALLARCDIERQLTDVHDIERWPGSGDGA